ncbi:DMT family transporter [Leadbettera azotonutricia]|uniref:Transporter n=1 Tax=Leadbettera azotonutricia (strain ATCC BAA-888 / DSM 13862 / ZAS-9) TaxID=545695 RepID=F5Y6K6_LEAAZ|nr:DMT family transporter [Leadbettera azotonutricia]AEF82662.1 transporter [Leadbettera azotonutricia ZAS-9]
MNKKALRADILLLLTACIWGFAFVAQKSGMDYVSPYSFNGIRFLLGSISLLPLIFFLRKRKQPTQQLLTRKIFFRSTLLAGTCLFIAASMQQIGIMTTTTGHSGFITGLYVVLVPMIGIIMGRKTGIPTWIGAVLTLTGLFFLSAMGNEGTINRGDIITAISALFWAFHVLVIDKLVQNIDPLILSSGQFAWTGIFSLIVAIALHEPISWEAVLAGIIPILYGGLCSVGIAYTLQVVAQKDAPPAHATIILCLEGCFAAIGGVLILHEALGAWTLLGFILMFAGMLVSQWEVIAGHGVKN